MELIPTRQQDDLATGVLMPRSDVALGFDLTDMAIFRSDEDAGSGSDGQGPAEIMKGNLSRLFCDPEPGVRAQTFDLLWHKNAVIYHADTARAGRAAVLEIASRFAERMDGLNCAPMWPVSGQNDLYMLRWIAHRDGAPVATGCHIALIFSGRIHSFYLIDD
ncbi:hypothetical protein [Sphingobium sp. HWE2-09]|uniref:hypothetical protein n=1 Tax=Sphingobium sp. HWE2-09 TaxID=3108390 RepID=UPI002DC614F6|nr:hypothetical protein [Sphingobium sp. HWE2-09]